MKFKNLILYVVGIVLAVVLTEFFFAGEILALVGTNYSDVIFLLNYFFAAIEGVLTLRGITTLTSPFPDIPLLGTLSITLPETSFIWKVLFPPP